MTQNPKHLPSLGDIEDFSQVFVGKQKTVLKIKTLNLSESPKYQVMTL